ncbi:MAG: DUF87 domain-containing protein [Treponemataceae bacterium]|nr:DUF87 domain-containing protein [Treponemataceae bacterium]
MKQSEKLTIPSGILFLAASAVILISIFLQFINFGSFRAFPFSALYNFGRILFSAYGYSSFLIPVFLLISAIMLFLPKWNTARGIYLLVSVIPFFTIAGLEYVSRIILTDITLPMKVMKYTAVFFISVLLVSIEYLVTGLIVDTIETHKEKKNPYVPVFEVNDEGNPIPEEIMKKTEANVESEAERETDQEKGKEAGETKKEDISEIDISDIAEDEYLDDEIPAFETSEDSSSSTNEAIEEDDEDIVPSFEAIEVPELEQPDTITKGQVDELSTIVPGFDDIEVKTEKEEIEIADDYADEEESVIAKSPVEKETVKETVIEEASEVPLTLDEYDSDSEKIDFAQEEVKSEKAKDSEDEEIITIDFDFGKKKEEPQIITLDFNSSDAPEMKLFSSEETDKEIVEKKIEEKVETDNNSEKKEVEKKIEPAPEVTEVETDVPLDSAEVEDFYSPEEEAFFMDPFAEEASADSGADAEAEITETAYKAEEASPSESRSSFYHIPTDGLLNSFENNPYWIIDDETREAGSILKETLSEFKIEAEITGIRKGPVITMFEILPAPGVRLNKIVALQDNIALRLAAASVRIVAPIPGKQAVGVEIPNRERAMVSFRELIEKDLPAFNKMQIPVVLGKDITGDAQMLDLTATPHLLIAGSTGSGKSVCVNSIILSILYKRSPRDVKMILIDPKVVELKLYNDIPHLLTPVITEPKKAFQALQYCLCEMERRYAMLDRMGVRDIKTYNRRIAERKVMQEKLPYIVVIIDEFADLMATTGKELENTVARLAAMSRAVGIHLVLATQRPSIDVITGLIKANIPTRIAFMVASKTDSRIIIDQMGAEKLLGKGDMLYASAIDPFPVRIQGTFVTEDEVENVVDYVKQFGPPDYIDDEIFVDDEDDDGDSQDDTVYTEGEDPLYEQALDIVVQAGKASASYIQRRLKIGYNRAARLVEEMEDRGIVGPANGSKPREIIHIP